MPFFRVFSLQISEHRNIPAILPNYFGHLCKVKSLPASTEMFLPFYRIISEGNMLVGLVIVDLEDLAEGSLPDHFEYFIAVGYVVVGYVRVGALQ